MTKGTIFIAFFVVLITNFTFQLLWGDRGILAYEELLSYQGELVRHLEIQERMNLLMNDRLSRLQNDRSTLIEESARLNYVEGDETLVFVRGQENTVSGMRQEEILRYKPQNLKDRAKLFRLFSFISGLSALLILLLWKRKESPEEGALNRIL